MKNSNQSLLNVVNKGEEEGFVSRNVFYSVVGLCNSGRPSTLSLFKPGISYYYGLLKLHKCKLEDIKPGFNIPIRLVNDPSQSPTSRSNKFINWMYIKHLQHEFCKDLVKDSTETLKCLNHLIKVIIPSVVLLGILNHYMING